MDWLSHLPWTAWAFLLLGAILGFTLWRHRTGRGWHGFAFIGLGLLMTPLLIMTVMTLMVEIPATNAVRELTGRNDVWVSCSGIFFGEIFNTGWEGEVAWDPATGGLSDTADLRSKQCSELRGYILSHPTTASDEQVIAIHVLTHEATHLTGILNEAKTECLAMQSDSQMVKLLSGSSDDKANLASRYYKDVYPRMPAAYRTADCTQGGTLDKSPEDNHFP